MSILLLPILAQSMTATMGDTSEAVARFDGTGSHLDLTTIGHLSLDVKLKRTAWSLTYSPSYSRLAVGEADSTSMLFQTGSLIAGLRLTPRTTVALSESAGFGLINLRVASLTPAATTATTTGANSGPATTTPGGTATTVLASPHNENVTLGTVETGLAVSHALNHVWTARTSASYSVSGGIGSTSQAVIPKAIMLIGDVSLSRPLSLVDSATLSVSASHIHIDPSADALTSILEATWARRLSRPVTISLGAGAAYADATSLKGDHFSGALPVASAAVSAVVTRGLGGGTLVTTTGSSVAPMVDRYTGIATAMWMNTLDVTWRKKRLSISIAGTSATALTNRSETRILSSYISAQTVTYMLDRRHWAVLAGTREAYQIFEGFVSPPVLFAGFVGLSYTTSTGPF